MKILKIGLIFLITLLMVSGVNAVIDQEILDKDAVLKSSTSLKSYVEKNGRLPNYVTINNKKYSMADYLDISSSFITNYDVGDDKGVSSVTRNLKGPKTKPVPKTIKVTISKSDYFDMSMRTQVFIQKNKRVPTDIGYKKVSIQFQSSVYGFSKVLDFFNKNRRMPNSLSLNVKKTSQLAKVMPKL